MGYNPNWTTDQIKKLVEDISPEDMKKDFEEYGFDVTVRYEDDQKKWTRAVQKGDYVKWISLINPLNQSVEEVTKVTAKSIFIDKRQYLKDTAVQMNKKSKIEPFLKKHKDLL